MKLGNAGDMEAFQAASAAHDLSLTVLFLRADPVVKGVMAVLLSASIVSWAVIIDRSIRLLRARRAARLFEYVVRRRAARIPDRASLTGLPAAIIDAGRSEWEDVSADESRAERRERLERAMRAAMAEGLRPLERGLSFLATVGSAAPFVGLFGTVWGIMNSFQAIAGSNETSLAVVAPGIAEALFATAVGLVVAIPAVVGYNKLTVELGRLGRALSAGIGSLGNRMSREPVEARL